MLKNVQGHGMPEKNINPRLVVPPPFYLSNFGSTEVKHIGRLDAVKELQDRNPWSFVLRDSSDRDKFALSYVKPDREIVHIQFSLIDGEVVCEKEKFKDIPSFIKHIIPSLKNCKS